MSGGLYTYSPRATRSALEWPDGKRLAFYVGVNVEHFHFGKPAMSIVPETVALNPDPLNHGWRDYGARVGIWRVMDILNKHGIRGSALLNADVCHEYPQIIESGNALGWAWCGHGWTNSEAWTGFEVEEERKALTELVARFERGTGSRPTGWLGPALSETTSTPALLAELGFSYVLDWCCDDQPFPLNVATGRMISVPYSIEINDVTLFLGTGLTGPDFYRVVRDQFDVLHREAAAGIGSVMCLALHPFIIGHPFRARYLDRVLHHISRHADDVWVTTSDEIAQWYLDHHYDAARAA